MNKAEHVRLQEKPVIDWYKETLGKDPPIVEYVEVPSSVPLGPFGHIFSMYVHNTRDLGDWISDSSYDKEPSEAERFFRDHGPNTVFIFPGFASFKDWDKGTQSLLAHELLHIVQFSEGFTEDFPYSLEAVPYFLERAYPHSRGFDMGNFRTKRKELGKEKRNQINSLGLEEFCRSWKSMLLHGRNATYETLLEDADEVDRPYPENMACLVKSTDPTSDGVHRKVHERMMKRLFR